MKSVLFITQYSPETRIVGDMVYTWHLLCALKHDKDVRVHVVAYQDPDRWYENETKRLAALVDEVTLVPFRHLKPWRMTLSRYPAAMKNRAHGNMLQAVSKILSRAHYDVVMFNSFRMAYLVRDLHVAAAKHVYISHNIEAEVAKSIYKTTGNVLQKIIYWTDYVKTAWWERQLIRRFDAITAICSYDADYFRRSDYPGQVRVIRPVVDVRPYTAQKPHTKKIIICGSFTWLPKRLNLNRILDSKSIANLVANDCRLQVVGRTLKEDIAKGNKLAGVNVTGPVDDINPYYEDAEVAMVPELAGGGFKLKIAEAVEHHIPIVAIRGSITDSNMQPGRHYLEATDFDDLIDRAIALVHDRDLQRDITENAVRLFKATYSLDAVSKEMQSLIQSD